MTFTKCCLIFFIAMVSTKGWSAEDDSFVSYDSIVKDLTASSRDSVVDVAPSEDDVDWNEIAIHGNLGFATSLVSLNTPQGRTASGLLKGVHLGFGINLFTRKARAEGAFTSYGGQSLNRDVRAELREFELRVVFLPSLNDKTTVRFGGGITARYMDLNVTNEGELQTSTPSSLFLIGFEHKLAKNVAVGPDLSYRSALISDTFDKAAWDGVIRLNASF